MFAEHEARRLHRALQLAQGDAGRFEKGQLEGDVVGDDVHAVDEVEDADAGPVQINDEDAVAAGVDLKQPDAGAVGVEARRLGVSDFGGEAFARRGARRELGRRDLQLARGLQLPSLLSFPLKESGEALRFRFVRRRLDVDRDPIRRAQHLAEQAARLRLLGAIDDLDAGERSTGRVRRRGVGPGCGLYPSCRLY